MREDWKFVDPHVYIMSSETEKNVTHTLGQKGVPCMHALTYYRILRKLNLTFKFKFQEKLTPITHTAIELTEPTKKRPTINTPKGERNHLQ